MWFIYHGNIATEVLYEIYKSKDTKLMQYDYNKPCCGKDRCDRESAVRKYVFWSFVDVGHNLLSASDVFGTLKFANGMKTPKWMLLKLIFLPILNRKTIPDITQYHSVQFHENGMSFWWYFNVGMWVFMFYLHASFSSGCKRVRELKWASKSRSSTLEISELQKKRRSKFMHINVLLRSSVLTLLIQQNKYTKTGWIFLQGVIQTKMEVGIWLWALLFINEEL